MPSRTRPIEKFAQVVAKCSAVASTLGFPPQNSYSLTNISQASVYGKCIVADYNSVHKDKCLTEFLRLKDCYMVREVGYVVSLLYSLRRRLLRRGDEEQIIR